MRGNQNCGDGNRSSVSSEGFCENDDDILNDSLIGMPSMSGINGDTDSQEGGGSDTNSSSGGPNIERNSSSGNRSGESSQESSDSMTKSKNYNLIKNLKKYDESSTNHVSINPNQNTNLQQCISDVPSTSCEIGDRTLLRRSSKDESVSSSESQQSGDECNIYYYDQKQPQNENNLEKYTDKDKTSYSWSSNFETDKGTAQTGVKLPSDSWEILFARAEGLYAHGHSSEARRLGVRLARELLQRPPDLAGGLRESYSNTSTRRKGRRHHHASANPPSHRLSLLASATLARCAFLCTVSFLLFVFFFFY